jgi:hypothetical protein
LATGGDRNSARATGFSSIVRACNGGDGNTATVTGDVSQALVGPGDSSTAIVDGNGSSAQAFVGDYNTAIATGDFIGAVGEGGGDTDIQPPP